MSNIIDFVYENFFYDRYGLLSAIFVSVKVSFFAIFLGLLFGIPIGMRIGVSKIYNYRIVKFIINILLSVPTVTIGMLVYILLKTNGVFGDLRLLFTTKAIIFGQFLLSLPIIISLTANLSIYIDNNLRFLIATIGANKLQTFLTLLYELRYNLITIGLFTYGRILSEIGISSMIGGNIKWYSRTITTSISLYTRQGEYYYAFFLSIILLAISGIINFLLIFIFNDKREESNIF